MTLIEVVLDASLAVLRYRSEIEFSVSGGAMGHLSCWLYQRDDVSWRCRWSQATDSITS